MCYETKGADFPLVFIHGGFGGLGTGLDPAVPTWRDHFAEHLTVITYHRRAAGRSGYAEEGFTRENFTGDIRELLGHLGHDRADVWGRPSEGKLPLPPDCTTQKRVTCRSDVLT